MAKYGSLLTLLTILAAQIQLSSGFFMLKIQNNCDFTMWPAIADFGDNSSKTDVPKFPIASTGFSLLKGESKTIGIGDNWNGLVWGRTLCSNDSLTGKFSCQTGDCGSGKVECPGSSFSRPVTLAALSSTEGSIAYDVSVTFGYNLPMMVATDNQIDLCIVTGCVFNLDTSCPAELSVMSKGKIIACGEACNIHDGCRRIRNHNQSTIFSKSCPRAYSYGINQQTAVDFRCSTYSLEVIFCPYPSQSSLFSKPMPKNSMSVPSGPSPTPTPTPTTSTTKQSPKKSIGSAPKTSNSKRKHTSLLVALPTSATIAMLLMYGVLMCIRKKKATKTAYFEVTEIKKAVDSLQFDFNTIRIATRNFADDNKLGEGGFGEVYKGQLENGQEIAVKRLSKNSGQGVAEFKTEVVLVAKLQHKNLVKLLGFCMAPNEKILVYEFLPNSSLDKFLFDQTRQVSLDWETRFKIIVGITRGLLYLHEDSRLKVIHRDLKASNILLDEDMNPKISDFGLAKLFGVDQTQDDTNRIVGTYGYMAPEYAITGHYSVKSDVYSFGVIVLEIVSGQRNRFFRRIQFEEALLHRAWRLWNEKKALDLVDEALGDNFPREEVLKCIHIGLLCIQEDAAERPRINSIVAAFNGQDINLPLPKPPNFFGTNNSNFEGNQTLDQHNSPCVHTGPTSITELYSRE